MAKGFTILFLLSISIMLASEYLLLQELFGDRRLQIMAPAALVLAVSIGIFGWTYKRFRKTSH